MQEEEEKGNDNLHFVVQYKKYCKEIAEILLKKIMPKIKHPQPHLVLLGTMTNFLYRILTSNNCQENDVIFKTDDFDDENVYLDILETVL